MVRTGTLLNKITGGADPKMFRRIPVVATDSKKKNGRSGYPNGRVFFFFSVLLQLQDSVETFCCFAVIQRRPLFCSEGFPYGPYLPPDYNLENYITGRQAGSSE